MSTPAQEAGFKLGNVYTVKTAGHHTFVVGDKVKYIRDDETTSPQFQRISDQRKGYVLLERFDANEPQLVQGVALQPVAVHVNLNGNSTTIVVQRNLTADEVAAVLKAIGQ